VDLRAYGDVGGKREPLVAPGEKVATTDRPTASKLLADRIVELEAARRNRALLGFSNAMPLGSYVRHHLIEKAKSRRGFTEKWLGESEQRLGRAIDFFGADKDVASITLKDISRFRDHLSDIDSPRGGKLSDGTVRHHLNVLSNLFRQAQAESVVPSGYNPVASLRDKPVASGREAHWLEVHDAALLLEAARKFDPETGDVALRLGEPLRSMYPIVATLLLTGGRAQEVLGLEVGDVSFRRGTITFRPNEWRTLKTKNALRPVPLFPQLAEILREHLAGSDVADDVIVGQIVPTGRLLFPSPRTGRMVRDIRKPLDAIAESVDWKVGEIRPHMLRHTYCAARLQTLDNGAPISPFTVGRELGHGGTSLVERVYGHLGTVRHRSEHLEYRIENHQDELAERLKVLGW
jgi:integrase